MFISGTGIGPTFVNVTFTEDAAPTGSAVYATGSGTAVTIDENSDSEHNPMTFDRCQVPR